MISDIKYIDEGLDNILKSLVDNLFLIKYDTTILDYTSNESTYIIKSSHFINQKLVNYIPEDLKEPLLNGIDKVIHSKKMFVIKHDLSKESISLEIKIIPYSSEILAVSLREISIQRKSLKTLRKIKKNLKREGQKSLISTFILQDDKLKYVNEAFESISGYSSEEIRNWEPYEFLKLIKSDYQDFVKEQNDLKQMNLNDNIPNYVVKGVRKDGSELWIEINSEYFTYEGRPAIIGSITEILENEKSSYNAKRVNKALIDSMPEGSFVISKSYEIEYYNLKILDIFNLVKELRGISIFEIIPKKFGDVLNELIKKTVMTNKSSFKYFPFKFKGKKDFFLIQVLQFDQERLAIFIRKKNDDRVTQVNFNIQKKKSKEFFNSLNEGVLIVQDNKIVFANNYFPEVIGDLRLNFEEWNFQDFQNLIVESNKILFQNWINKLEDDNKEIIPHITYQILNKKGESKKVEHFAKGIFFEDQFSDLIVIFDEKSESLMDGSLNHLKFQDKIKNFNEDLIQRISHELKTPLTSIYIASEILLNFYRKNIDSDILGFVEIINKGGKRLKNLIENFMEVSLLDLGKVRLDLKIVNLSSLIISCVGMHNELIKKRNLNFKSEIQPNINLYLDEEKITVVFSNLILNAINNTPKGGSIHLKSIEEKKAITIEITDTGVGFTKDELSSIFKKFGKIERFGKNLDVEIDGPGLGFYITKKLLKLHDGTIKVVSQGRDMGATQIVTLPKDITA